MALPGTMQLSEDALERLVTRYDIGELHESLRPTAVWRDDTERAELDRTVGRELSAQQGIYEGSGRLDRDFEDSLRCLCRPEVAFVAMTHVKGTMRYLLTCSRGREGLLAIRERSRVTLRQVDANNLHGALVTALPDHPPARFQPVSVPIEDRSAESSGYLRPAGPNADRSSERRAWDALASMPQVGGGQVILELRDSMGRGTESPDPLCFVDTESGCWYYVTEHRGGRRYLFCAPASRQELAGKIRAMRDQLERVS